MVGAGGYVVDTGVLAVDTGVRVWIFKSGRAVSIFVRHGFTWLGNRYLTFARPPRARPVRRSVQEWLQIHRRQRRRRGWSITAPRSLLVRFAAPPFNHKFVAQACGVLAGLIFNFTLSKKLVFRGPRLVPSTVTDLMTAKARQSGRQIQPLNRRGRDARHQPRRAAAHRRPPPARPSTRTAGDRSRAGCCWR